MATCISHSPEETESLGESWGRAADEGLVICLCGELGAGKTRLVKGLARGLRISDRVQSPSFALVNIYTGGRFTLYHLDLYRLETREQILAAGLEDYFQPTGVAAIEWAERWFGTIQNLKTRIERRAEDALPYRLRWVQMDEVSETERHISYEDIGA